MKILLKFLAAFGILAIVFFAYQQNHETKTKVYAKDFEGEWRGVWNWSPNETCVVTLSGTAAKVKNLPMKNIMDINFVLPPRGKSSSQKPMDQKAFRASSFHFRNQRSAYPQWPLGSANK
jgi:hypothetical protein